MASKYPHPRVEFIYFGADGEVRSRHDCVHRHRFVRTARKCARESVRGVPADGGEVIGVVYDESGEMVAQVRVLDHVTANLKTVTWSARTFLLAPGNKLWKEVPRA